MYLDTSVALVAYTRDCTSTKIMEKMLMVKPEEFWALVDYYKGKITEGILLNKAARVTMEAQLLLQDPTTHAGLKEPVVKQLLMKEQN